jgi:hypothetical protein
LIGRHLVCRRKVQEVDCGGAQLLLIVATFLAKVDDSANSVHRREMRQVLDRGAAANRKIACQPVEIRVGGVRFRHSLFFIFFLMIFFLMIFFFIIVFIVTLLLFFSEYLLAQS